MSYQNYSGLWLPDSTRSGINYIRGTGAWETINGTNGADEFDGGGGRDTFVGGAGDDFYWLGDGRDPVIEQAGGGIDTIKLWVSANLAPNVENLIVFGGGSYAAGNDLNNQIIGEGGSQYLYGGKGEDVLVGGGGDDTFIVKAGEGNEVIQDFQWGDKIRLIGGPLTSFDAVKAAMTQRGADVILNDGGTMIALRNTTIGQFQASDFQLPVNYQALGTPVFNDDFNSLQTGQNSLWRTNFGYGGDGIDSFTLKNNNEAQIYVAPDFKGTSGSSLGLNPYSLNNGVLTISANPVNDWQSSQMWGYKYSSGMLISNQAYLYGYFEMRADVPEGQGLWPAFWMIGPNNNEIDILEMIGTNPQVPDNAIHWPGGNHASNHNFQTEAAGFHTYGMMWNPTDIIFYIDGTEAWRVATPSVMNQPMNMIVNLAVGGNWAGLPDSTTPFPANMQIDYVRAYGLPGSSVTAPTPTAPTTTSPTPSTPSTGSSTATGDQVITSTATHSLLTGGAGNDTINAGVGGDTVTGGAGSDVIAFANKPWEPVHVTDFKVGVDKIDLSALLKQVGYTGSDPVADKYIVIADNGAGGTKILFDKDGAAAGQQWPDRIIELDGVPVSGVTWASLTGAAPAPTAPVTTTPTAPTTPTTTTPTTGGLTGQVLTASGPYSTLTGGAGADTINASQGFDVLTGGAGADSFVLGKEPWAPIEIKDFQVGTDKLDLSAMFKASGYTGSDPVADKFVVLKQNGANTEVFFDRDGAGSGQLWPNRVLVLDNVSGASWGQLSGAGGASTTSPTTTAPTTTTPTAPATGGSIGQVLTASGPSSTLTGGAGADTLNASQGFDVLTGGAGADSFVLGKEPWAPIEIKDFQVGTDKLDLSALFKASGYSGSDPVADKYIVLKANGANTEVFFDRDGAGSGQLWPNRVLVLDNVNAGGVTWSQLSGGASASSTSTSTPAPVATTPAATGAAGQVLTASGPSSILTGTAGSDTINGSQGFDTLTGGAGSDRFAFANEPWAPEHITDFRLGEDVIDLTALFAKSGYTGHDPIGDRYVVLADDGAGGTALKFDRDAAAPGQLWPNYIIDIEHVSVSSLSSSTGWLIS